MLIKPCLIGYWAIITLVLAATLKTDCLNMREVARTSQYIGGITGLIVIIAHTMLIT